MSFFFQRYNMCFISEFFFRVGQILFNLARSFAAAHHKKTLCFFLCWSPIIFDNLESGKEIIVLEKSQEKVSNFNAKNLYEPWGQFVLTPLK